MKEALLTSITEVDGGFPPGVSERTSCSLSSNSLSNPPGVSSGQWLYPCPLLPGLTTAYVSEIVLVRPLGLYFLVEAAMYEFLSSRTRASGAYWLC